MKGSFTTQGAYEQLRERAHAYTPLGKIRELTRGYSKRHHVPIRISGKAFDEGDTTDACLVFKGGRFTMYVHPIMQYYNEKEIRKIIEHEVEHLKVERRRVRGSPGGTEYMLGKPKPGWVSN